jgi:hypothetical protein
VGYCSPELDRSCNEDPVEWGDHSDSECKMTCMLNATGYEYYNYEWTYDYYRPTCRCYRCWPRE